MLYKLAILFICTLWGLSAHSQLNTELNFLSSSLATKAKEVGQHFSFSYYAKFLGPSLSNNLPQGATYNRSSSGQDWKDDKGDPTDSQQIFHAISLGIKLPRNMILRYNISFQDNLNDDITYQYKNFDGTYANSTRDKGRSGNNDRISLWVPSLYANNHLFLSSTFFYEFPTTEGAKETRLQYGLGIQPTLGFYSSIPWLYYGISASLEHYRYPQNQFVPSWCVIECHKKTNQVRRQKGIYSLSPYMGLILSDKLTLRSALVFDWDQFGHSHKLRENLDDIFSIGLNYSFGPLLSVQTGVEGSIENLSTEHSALYASLYLSL